MYLIEILHQTTTLSGAFFHTLGCILSKFYIKPQHRANYWCSRSSCILSKFYIKPQLSTGKKSTVYCCILSKFYIKPQLEVIHCFQFVVVSYRNSTSNHNCNLLYFSGLMLYLIEILHQTTTRALCIRHRVELYLIEILHQTTTCGRQYLVQWSCILSKFYIKPQLLPLLLCSALRCILSKFYIKPQRRASY